MNDAQLKFLSLLGGLPARLEVEQVAWVLNCQPHDVPALVAAKLLKPLGHPPPNAIKFFATLDVLELARDRSWLVKMTNGISQEWKKKNARRKGRAASRVPDGTSARELTPMNSAN
jgi:hypothetical protein